MNAEKIAELSKLSTNELLAMILVTLQSLPKDDDLRFDLGILQKEIQTLQRGVYISGGTVAVKNVKDDYIEPLIVSQR